jgi:hypothetical protein
MMEPVFCAKCGRQLAELPGLPREEQPPCPDCGSTSRSFNESLHDGVNMNAQVSALHQRKGKTIGFTESARQGRSASAGQSEDGALSCTLNGSSPQGEEDTLSTCRILVNKLMGKYPLTTRKKCVMTCPPKTSPAIMLDWR